MKREKKTFLAIAIYVNRAIILYVSTRSIMEKSTLFGTMQNDNPPFTSAFAKVKSLHTYLYVGLGFVKVLTWIC